MGNTGPLADSDEVSVDCGMNSIDAACRALCADEGFRIADCPLNYVRRNSG